jgi:purine-nucleoside phosphorylase
MINPNAGGIMIWTNDVVEQYYFGKPERIADKILFIKRENRLAEYQKYFSSCAVFGNVWRGVTGVLRGEPVTIIAAGVGPSMIGDCVLALDRPGAVCLYSGTCGSLVEQIGIGDYVLAERAVCGDGYSALLGHEPLSVVAADEAIFRRVASAFRACSVYNTPVTTFTTGSVVLENEASFWQRVDPECKAIDMGCAPFYAACLRSQKRPAACFWVTDLPTLNKSFFDPLPEEDQQRKQAAFERVVTLDLELITHI